MNQIEDRKARILIVDDNSKNIQVLGTFLKSADYLINIGRNGVQALEIAEKIQPDLILLDIMMPEMDGYEACRLLKARKVTRHIPVIFLTAKVESKDIVEGFEIGAVDYITKPFKSAELLARVQTHLEIKFSRELILQQTHEMKELLHILCHDLTNPFHNIQGMLELLNDDPSLFDLFLGYMNISLENGLNIIDLVRKMRSLEEKGNLDIAPFSLKTLLEESQLILRQKLIDKKITIEAEIDDTISVLVEKTSFINSVINNLFSNAIKFSHPGAKIEVTTTKKENAVDLVIRDHGIGIPEGLIKDLFNISKPTNRTGTAGEIGTGFGMPLVEKFVKAYGGSIHISSTEEATNPTDHGTEIHLHLPSP